MSNREDREWNIYSVDGNYKCIEPAERTDPLKNNPKK